jgi:hypothetical protein
VDFGEGRFGFVELEQIGTDFALVVDFDTNEAQF